MKQIEIKYSQLLGNALSINALAKICIKCAKKTDKFDANCEKKGKKGFKKIGSKKLYGFSLLVDRLMSY